MPVISPHHRYRLGTSLTLGAENLRCGVIKEDFQANWAETEVVSEDPDHRGYYGKVLYYQVFLRDRPMVLRPNHPYRLEVTFEPHIVMIDELE
jgi:hypothetical protein